MKKIVIINNAFPNEKAPNAGAYVKTIADLLDEDESLEIDKIVLFKEQFLGISPLDKIISYLKLYWKIIMYPFRKEDIIYIHHYPHIFFPFLFKKLKNKKVVINFHGNDVFGLSKISALLNKLSYNSLKSHFMFIFPSNYLKHIFEKKYKVKATNTFISPSGGVNLDIFKAKKKTGSSEVTHIGFASQLDYFKGVDDLLALINQLEASSFCFHVIEYGNVSKYLPQLKKHENIIVHKPYKKEQMYQFYHKIDLLFFPTKQESLGLVALEAMACNIPVIGPNQFALSEIIEPGISGEKYNDPCEILALIHQFCQQQEYYTPRKWINGKYDARSVQQALVSFFKEAFS